MALYKLAENCDYGDLKEEMIRDRLVVGIRDTALSEKMQMDPNLTLKTAKKSIRQREAVHEQQQTLKNITDGNLDAIRPHRPLNSGDNRRRNRANTSDRRDQQRKNRRHATCSVITASARDTTARSVSGEQSRLSKTETRWTQLS